MPEILNGRNLIDIAPFCMSSAPFESSRKGLPNGAKLVQNGSLSKKLRLLVIPSFTGPHIGHLGIR